MATQARALLLVFAVFAARAADPVRMVVVPGSDLSGTVHKKLGLPARHYCWQQCMQDPKCSGVRWGVVANDAAGLCILLSGELAAKQLTSVKTDDGKPIRIVAARKQRAADGT